MIRVTKSNPCPVCQRPDWCMYSEDGKAAICARVSEGSKKKCGDAGWLHIIKEGDRPTGKPYKRFRPEPVRDFSDESEIFQTAIADWQINDLAGSLGVKSVSLKRLNVGFDGEAYTFPMMDENRKIIGIRRRFDDGRKFALAGSSNGLFIPGGLDKEKPLVICEGPTDCAAGLDLGFEAIGRPNCASKIAMTARFARGRKKIVIICDNDMPGRDGAKKLAEELVRCCTSVKIISPPPGIKDLREWKQKRYFGGLVRYGS